MTIFSNFEIAFSCSSKDESSFEIVNDIKLMLYDQEIARWLGTDKIKQQSEFHASLSDSRAPNSCDFSLKLENFAEWYDGTGASQLVVFGDMGIGKSVTAAFVVDELLQRRSSRVPRPLVCYHYCQDDNTGSITYILSVLMLSILEQLPGLKKTFHDWHQHQQSCGNIEPLSDFRKFGDFFRDLVESLSRPIFVVIDGLDECSRKSRAELLRLLADSWGSDSNARFILFSRYDGEITEYFHQELAITLVSDVERDRMIVTHSVEKHLNFLMRPVKEMVIEALSRMSRGSAIWTAMVVNFLESQRKGALGPMRQFLEELHMLLQLSKLYDILLERYTAGDQENLLLAWAALKILAASSRPLSVQELAWAAALATAPADLHSIAALAVLIDHERILALNLCRARWPWGT